MAKKAEEKKELLPYGTIPEKQKREFGTKLPEEQKRNKRVNFLLREPAYEDLKALAAAWQTTPNEIINDYVEKLIVNNSEVIVKYRELQLLVGIHA